MKHADLTGTSRSAARTSSCVGGGRAHTGHVRVDASEQSESAQCKGPHPVGPEHTGGLVPTRGRQAKASSTKGLGYVLNVTATHKLRRAVKDAA